MRSQYKPFFLSKFYLKLLPKKNYLDNFFFSNFFRFEKKFLFFFSNLKKFEKKKRNLFFFFNLTFFLFDLHQSFTILNKNTKILFSPKNLSNLLFLYVNLKFFNFPYLYNQKIFYFGNVFHFYLKKNFFLNLFYQCKPKYFFVKSFYDSKFFTNFLFFLPTFYFFQQFFKNLKLFFFNNFFLSSFFFTKIDKKLNLAIIFLSKIKNFNRFFPRLSNTQSLLTKSLEFIKPEYYYYLNYWLGVLDDPTTFETSLHISSSIESVNFEIDQSREFSTKVENSSDSILESSTENSDLFPFYIWKKNLTVFPYFLQRSALVYCGSIFKKLVLKTHMLNYKIGSFCFTRKVVFSKKKINLVL